MDLNGPQGETGPQGPQGPSGTNDLLVFNVQSDSETPFTITNALTKINLINSTILKGNITNINLTNGKLKFPKTGIFSILGFIINTNYSSTYDYITLRFYKNNSQLFNFRFKPVTQYNRNIITYIESFSENDEIEIRLESNVNIPISTMTLFFNEL